MEEAKLQASVLSDHCYSGTSSDLMAKSDDLMTKSDTSLDLITKSEYDKVVFYNVSEDYPTDGDVQCCYDLTESVVPAVGDKIALFRVGWNVSDMYETFVDAIIPDENNEMKDFSVIFKVETLPKDEGMYYQFCYISKDGMVRGASTPFKFRRPTTEELVEIEDPESDLLIIRSKTALMEEKLREMQLKNSELLKYNANLEKELNKKDIQCSETESALNSLQENVKSLQSELDSAASAQEDSRKSLKALLMQLSQERLKFHSQTVQNDAYVEELRSTIKTISIQQEKMTNQIDCDQREIERLKSDHLNYVASGDEHLKSLSEKYAKLSHDLLTEHQHVLEGKEKVAEINDELSKEQNKRIELEKKYSVLEQEKEQLLGHLLDTEHMLSAMEKSKSMATQELMIHTDAKLKLTEELKEAQVQIQLLQKKLLDEESEKKNLQLELSKHTFQEFQRNKKTECYVKYWPDSTPKEMHRLLELQRDKTAEWLEKSGLNSVPNEMQVELAKHKFPEFQRNKSAECLVKCWPSGTSNAMVLTKVRESLQQLQNTKAKTVTKQKQSKQSLKRDKQNKLVEGNISSIVPIQKNNEENITPDDENKPRTPQDKSSGSYQKQQALQVMPSLPASQNPLQTKHKELQNKYDLLEEKYKTMNNFQKQWLVEKANLNSIVEDLKNRLKLGASEYRTKYIECLKLEKKMKKFKKQLLEEKKEQNETMLNKDTVNPALDNNKDQACLTVATEKLKSDNNQGDSSQVDSIYLENMLSAKDAIIFSLQLKLDNIMKTVADANMDAPLTNIPAGFISSPRIYYQAPEYCNYNQQSEAEHEDSVSHASEQNTSAGQNFIPVMTNELPPPIQPEITALAKLAAITAVTRHFSDTNSIDLSHMPTNGDIIVESDFAGRNVNNQPPSNAEQAYPLISCPICEYSSEDIGMLEDHIEKHYAKSCPVCNQIFAENVQREFEEHVQLHFADERNITYEHYACNFD